MELIPSPLTALKISLKCLNSTKVTSFISIVWSRSFLTRYKWAGREDVANSLIEALNKCSKNLFPISQHSFGNRSLDSSWQLWGWAVILCCAASQDSPTFKNGRKSVDNTCVTEQKSRIICNSRRSWCPRR